MELLRHLTWYPAKFQTLIAAHLDQIDVLVKGRWADTPVELLDHDEHGQLLTGELELRVEPALIEPEIDTPADEVRRWGDPTPAPCPTCGRDAVHCDHSPMGVLRDEPNDDPDLPY